MKKNCLPQLITVLMVLFFFSCEKDEETKSTETPSFILGCMDEDALNFNPNATNDDNSCTYSISYTFGGVWSIENLEYATEIDLSIIDASILPDNIAPFISLLGDYIVIQGEDENAGSFNLNSSDFSYVQSLNFETEPVPLLNGLFELPSFPIDMDSEGTWTLENNDEDIIFTDAASGSVQTYEIQNITDDFALLRGSISMPIEVPIIGSDYDLQLELLIQLEK